MTRSRQYCTFLLDGLLLGVEVAKVQEVLRFEPITRVPLADPVVRGLINLRGQIVTALDLRQRLALKPRPADQNPMNVIVRTSAGPFSLLVDGIGEVLEVDEGDFEQPPETVRGVARELIRGAYKLLGRLLLVLDLDKSVNLNSYGAVARAETDKRSASHKR
jgi:purine-binding chemotaxis protein CheW